MRKKKMLALIIPIIILALLGFKILQDIKHPFSTKIGETPILVGEGDSLFNVVNGLKKKGLIKNEFLFKIYIKKNNLNTNIKPGEYYIDNSQTIRGFVDMLNKGTKDGSYVQITIPEGYEIEQIAALLDAKGIITKEEFLESCKKYKVPSYVKVSNKLKYALEGYLFPDTYEFKKGTKGEEIITRMLKQFEVVLKDINKKEVDNIHELITAASLIEKEARIDEDRPKIASVLYNRLNKNMMLQMDASVLYAIGKHKNRVTYEDLKVKSPYNTYVVKGLPPGPICSPGKPSIEAALNPLKTDYVFYVLEDNKKHYFTNNYKDFLKAKEKYKNRVK